MKKSITVFVPYIRTIGEKQWKEVDGKGVMAQHRKVCFTKEDALQKLYSAQERYMRFSPDSTYDTEILIIERKMTYNYKKEK